ncbi:ultraviolet-B receptor UVR8, partial [Tanacetum coccineum]
MVNSRPCGIHTDNCHVCVHGDISFVQSCLSGIFGNAADLFEDGPNNTDKQQMMIAFDMRAGKLQCDSEVLRTMPMKPSPNVMSSLGITVKMVADGAEHIVAITEDGDLYGWGWGRYGNLGLGDRFDRNIPEKVSIISARAGWAVAQ